jgi:hypothetical protein
MGMKERYVIAAAFLAALLSGCPYIEVTEVELVPDSVGDGSFSLTAKVLVETGEDKQIVTHGLIGVWMPEGWEANSVRITGPEDGAPISLIHVPGLEPAYPGTFPYVPGAWKAFATEGCISVPPNATYEAQVDATGPAGTERVSMGLGFEGNLGTYESGRLPDGGPEMTVDTTVEAIVTQIDIDLSAATAKQLAYSIHYDSQPNDEISNPLTGCPDTDEVDGGADDDEYDDDCCACPVPEVAPGPRGCSCSLPGRSSSKPISIVSLLAHILGLI